ncbi:MAG TPA: ABC transporter substrate-binding protein [Chloroflexota bacterium]|nr:ABC transporter substrate-binding protein [Chloroflexota bacterium]
MSAPLTAGITKRRFLHLVALSAAASAVAACGPAAAPASPPAAPTPAQAAKPAAPAQTTPVAPAQATPAQAAVSPAKKGGTFTYAEAGDFNNFNPWNFSAVNFEMYDQVFSRLLWKDGTGKANPDLAESWQLAPDNLSISLKLRTGLKWHDGKAVTSQDFVDMFGYTSDPALAADPSVMKIKGIMGPVKDVTAPDPSTVQVSFAAPVPYITDILDYWFLIRIEDKTDPQFVKKLPVGTGPFKMAEWVPQQYARFSKFADYWSKDLPTLDEFLFKRLSQAETLLPNFKSGSLDGVLLTSFSDVAPLQADTNYGVDVNDNAGSIFNMMVNTAKPPLDKMEVRQALSYALNRVDLVKTAFFGVAKPITTTFYSPASLGYREDLVMAHPFDLAMARKLLDSAGVKNLDITLVVTPAWPQMKLWGLVWQQDLAKINVNLKLNEVENAKFYDIGAAKDFQDNDLVAWLNGRTTRDPAIFWSTQGNYRANSQNPRGFVDADLEKLVAAGAIETDVEQRRSIYQQLNQRAIDQSHVIPVATNPRIFAYRNAIQGVSVDLNGNLFLANASNNK